MDLDAFIEAHGPTWRRLESLVKKPSLDPQETLELFDLYQSTSTHLSIVRSSVPDPELVAGLSRLLMKTRATMGTTSTGWRGLARLFTHSGPLELYKTRYWWLTTWAVFHGLVAVMTTWFVMNPQWQSQIATPEMIRQFVEHDFVDYYSTYPAQDFAFQVWTNNAYLCAVVIALGIAGLPVILMLWTNLLNLVLSAAIMITNGAGEIFFGLILPHGLLELTMVCVSAAVGLRVFWSWVSPGARSRTSSLAQVVRQSVSLIAVTTVALMVCGIIEAFVTPSSLPTWARIGIGVVAFVGFLVYGLGLGRQRWLELQQLDAARRDAAYDTELRPSEVAGLTR